MKKFLAVAVSFIPVSIYYFPQQTEEREENEEEVSSAPPSPVKKHKLKCDKECGWLSIAVKNRCDICCDNIADKESIKRNLELWTDSNDRAQIEYFYNLMLKHYDTNEIQKIAIEPCWKNSHGTDYSYSNVNLAKFLKEKSTNDLPDLRSIKPDILFLRAIYDEPFDECTIIDICLGWLTDNQLLNDENFIKNEIIPKFKYPKYFDMLDSGRDNDKVPYFLMWYNRNIGHLTNKYVLSASVFQDKYEKRFDFLYSETKGKKIIYKEHSKCGFELKGTIHPYDSFREGRVYYKVDNGDETSYDARLD